MNPLPNCSKLAINWENNNDLIIFRHDVIVNFFLTGFCFPCQVYMLVQVSCQYHYWFWSYDNFLLLEIDQKSGNRKYRVWVLPNIWRLEQVRDTKFGMNVSKKTLLNAAKCQGYNFYHF